MAGELVHRIRPAAGEPEGALVLLHGRGADEHDLLPLLEALDPERRLVGVTPRGPLSLPPGGAHWYVVRSDRVSRQRHVPRRRTTSSASWFDALPERTGVPIERTVIGGFSQGAVMSYALGLGQRSPDAGRDHRAVGLPARRSPGFSLDLESRRGLPVAIGHGTLDPVIGIEFGRDARDRLAAAGLDVLYRESPMSHTIDTEFIAELRDWLAARIPAAAS